MSTTISSEDSVLRTLRDLMPARSLSVDEARQRAEAQANRLLDLFGLTAPAVPCALVSELPHIRVEESFDLPVSGAAFWDGTSWVLSLNAADSLPRRRFSLMHEFKHVLDHPLRRVAFGAGDFSSDAMERIADYFAACVLMPKRWIKTAFFSDSQSVERLAAVFVVSRQAMSYRLAELGLTSPRTRCATSWPPMLDSPATKTTTRRHSTHHFGVST
ncbi:MAG: ImmA/IrrE family metallo-endopeptidase [Thermoleophilia bacterium]